MPTKTKKKDRSRGRGRPRSVGAAFPKGGLDDDAFSDASDFEAFDRQLKRQDPYGRWVAANREERGHRERLVNIQGEFLNPVVAHRMRAKNNPYRRKTLYDQLKEITNAEDACTRALRADRLEGWTRCSETTEVRHVLKIDDGSNNRTRPKNVRKSDAGADMVFMMDNADVLEDPVGRLVEVGERAQRHREEQERRQDIEHRMAETQEKFGIQRMQIVEEQKKVPSPTARAVAQKKRATEMIVFEQPVSFAIGARTPLCRGQYYRAQHSCIGYGKSTRNGLFFGSCLIARCTLVDCGGREAAASSTLAVYSLLPFSLLQLESFLVGYAARVVSSGGDVV